jgi:hypothetical protein
MKKPMKPILDGPLWTVVLLVILAVALGVIAYVPIWHGSSRSLLRMSFWTVAGLSVIILPLATRTRQQRRSGS